MVNLFNGYFYVQTAPPFVVHAEIWLKKKNHSFNEFICAIFKNFAIIILIGLIQSSQK